MGGKIEHNFQIEHWRGGVSGFEVIAAALNIDIARAAFEAAVLVKGGKLYPGDQLLLRHGARVIVRFPPEGADDQPAPVASTCGVTEPIR